MKQENKEILLKDICARLPYRVKCSFGVDDAIYEITGINPSACGASEIQATHVKSSINGDFKLNSCKPYLFPLSSMTAEQKRNLISLFNCHVEITQYEIKFADYQDSNMDNWNKVFNWCYKNHFDINSLIPMGLANDATNKNIY